MEGRGWGGVGLAWGRGGGGAGGGARRGEVGLGRMGTGRGGGRVGWVGCAGGDIGSSMNDIYRRWKKRI